MKIRKSKALRRSLRLGLLALLVWVVLFATVFAKSATEVTELGGTADYFSKVYTSSTNTGTDASGGATFSETTVTLTSQSSHETSDCKLSSSGKTHTFAANETTIYFVAKQDIVVRYNITARTSDTEFNKTNKNEKVSQFVEGSFSSSIEENVATTIPAGGVFWFELTSASGKYELAENNPAPSLLETVTINFTFETTETGVDGNAVFFVPNDTANVFYYSYLDQATAAAENTTSHRIIVTASGYARNSDDSSVLTIPATVELVIPYAAYDEGFVGPEPNNYLTQSNAYSSIGSKETGKVAYAYCTLTVESGKRMDVYGKLNVNGQRQNNGQPMTGVVLGGYGKLVLGTQNTGTPVTDESSMQTQLVIKSGGALYAYGYVTGTGLVDVESGGTVHELLQLACWPGGSNGSNWNNISKADKDLLFILTQYYVQNIESPMKVRYGATVNTEAVFAVSGTTQYKSTPFITASGVSNPGLFLLSEESSYLLRVYDVSKDRMNYFLKGGASEINSIQVTLVGSASINSSDYILPINHNMTIIVESDASVSSQYKLALLPGAELIIKEGASATLTNEAYIFDVGDFTNYHFFNRGAYTANTKPNHCPVPYVATKNSVSPYAAKLDRFTYGDDDTKGYYPQVKNITVSGKLQVDGTLTLSGNGALLTTNGSQYTEKDANGKTIKVDYSSNSADKAIVGSGVIINNGTPVDKDMRVGYSSESALLNTYATYGLANMAGVGTLQPLAKGTYYGQGDGYWYQHAVMINGITAAISVIDTNGVASSALSIYDKSTVTGTVVAVSVNSASISFDLDGTYVPKIASGTATLTVVGAGSESGTVRYMLSNITSDVVLGLDDQSGNEVTVVTIAKNALGAEMVGAERITVRLLENGTYIGYYTDAKCSTAATVDNIGNTVYIMSTTNAVAAIGPDKDDYTYAYMNVAEAVAAATGSNNYVTVLLDRTLTTAIVVAKGQNITIDLGGKKLDGGTKSFEPLTNNGTLRLINGTITYAASKGAIVRNNGTIEYIEGVTLNQTYSTSSTSTYAIYNSGGATIREIRSGTFCTGAKSAGYVINNYGTIETIGTYGKTVTITGRRGIVVQDGTITTIGGAGSTVVITSGQRCIEVLKGKKIGTIGMNGSTVTLECSGMSMYRSGIYNAGTITTIGGEGSTLNFKLAPTSSQTMSSYAINITTTGTVTTIGAAGSTISITGSSAQKGQNSETYPDNHMEGIYIAGKVTNIGSKANGSYPASKLTIDVSHSGKYGSSYGIYVKGNVTNLGAEGASISITSIYTGTVSSDTLDEHGYGIKNEGTITNLGAAGAFIEIISNQYGVYNASGITINSITDVVVISTDDTGTYYALYNKGTISMINSGDFHHPNGRNNAVYNPDDQNYPAGYSLSSKTRVITIDGVDYPCYFVHTHTYENCLCIGCDIFRFYATNVNLGNNLDMMFAFPAGVFAEGTDLSGYYALFTHVDGTTTKLEFEDWQMLNINGSQSEDGEDYYVVFYSFPAKQMTDTVSVTIYDGSDKAVSISKTDSIQAYAGRMLKKATTSDALKNVIVTMLNYGSACQVQFGYKTEALANSILDEELRKTYEQKTGDGISITPGAATPSIAGHNLEVESNIIFHIALNGVATGTDVTVSFIGHKGNNVSYTTKVKDNYSVEITGLVVADHARTITLTIGNTTLTTSIDTYISNMGEGEANNVFYAFNQFAAAAYAYQHPKEATA